MEAILNFLVDNYLWFLIISLILIFGLIGYIVDAREKKTPKLHFQENEDINMESEVAEDKSLKEMLEEQENENVEVAIETVNLEQNVGINDVLAKSDITNENELPKE